MNRQKSIIFIGPVCAGKSTQSRLLAKALDMPSVSLDSIAAKYYLENGFSQEIFDEALADQGFYHAYKTWWPSLAFAAEQVLQDHPHSVIDFGAGHSHYEDEALFERIQTALADCTVVLLLPSEDPERSIAVLKERSRELRGTDWVRGGYDFIMHWVKDDCNHQLATLTVYTEGKTEEETRDEIIRSLV